jgi:hypothetical protein
MKKILFLAVALMATMTMSAQNMYIKPMVGATMSKFTSIDDSKFRFGVVGGAEFGYKLAEPFDVTAGVLVAMQGSNYDDDPFMKDYSTSTTVLNIPVLANYYIIPGLAIKAGIQPSFLLGQKTKGTEIISGLEEKFEETSTDGSEKFTLDIPLGLSYEFSNFVIDARYNLGITKVAKHNVDKKPKNSVIMLTLGYKIPF